MPISYTKRGWTNNSPPAINAANLGAMDDGLKLTADKVDTIAEGADVTATALASAIEGGTPTTTPDDTDKLPGVKSDHSLLYYTWASVKTALWTAWGSLINSGTAKSTPVDADAFTLMDSAASNATKKLTWANIVTAIKSAIQYVSLSTGFTVSGGTTSKTITVSENADTANITTAAGKSNADNATATQTAGKVPLFNSAAGLNANSISFPGISVPSSDPNTLDDYEEGTWYATVGGYITTGTYETASQACSYTKIGRLVHLIINITLASAFTGGGVGDLSIIGMPFGINSAMGAAPITSGITFTNTELRIVMGNNTHIVFRQFSSSSISYLNISALGVNAFIQANVFYHV